MSNERVQKTATELRALATWQFNVVRSSSRQVAYKYFWLGDKLVHTKWFKNTCKRAFKRTDLNGNNSISEQELYVAVLLLYNQINVKIPGRNHAAPPFSRVRANFRRYVGNEKDARLTEEQFVIFCQDICIELMPRIVLQAIGSLFVAPLVAVTIHEALEYWTNSLGVPWIMFLPESIMMLMIASAFMMIGFPILIVLVERKYLKVKHDYVRRHSIYSRKTKERLLQE